MQYSDFKSEMWSVMYLVRSSMQKVIEPVVQSEGLSMIQAFILFTIAVEPVTNISKFQTIVNGMNELNELLNLLSSNHISLIGKD